MMNGMTRHYPEVSKNHFWYNHLNLRLGEPEEAAQFVLFVAPDQSFFMGVGGKKPYDD